MSSYKVPQDVEAEDKLIGPFSFRQFIYLIVVAIAGFVAYMLSQIFLGLILVPLPVILFFLALALPLRKDQPMESYLLAMVQFHLKPRVRLWNPDGSIGLVEVTAPHVSEDPRTKDISGEEASRRLAYLAQVIDTGGWVTRGLSGSDAVSDTIVAEAQQAEDMLDDGSDVGQSFDKMISTRDTSRLEAMRAQFQQSLQQATPQQLSAVPAPAPAATSTLQQPVDPADGTLVNGGTSVVAPDAPAVEFNPYPASMHQRVISPSDSSPVPAEPAPAAPTETPPKPSPEQPSPDIIRLANNNDLSISAIAREAHRIADQKEGEEVVISLR